MTRRRATTRFGVGAATVAAVAYLRTRARRSTRGGADREVLAADGVKRLYDKVARFYDVAAIPYGRTGAARLADRALAELRLSSGDTVVDLGTGTGRNLVRLAEMVGPTGTVIGVDISPEMLVRARAKIGRQRLTGVDLVEADVATYEPPPDTQAIVASYAIEMLADYDAVIGRLVSRLRDDGRIAIAGLRDPQRWPRWLVRLGSAINRPFGVSEAYRSHRPWESINRYTSNSVYDEALGGAAYLAAGSRPPSASSRRTA